MARRTHSAPFADFSLLTIACAAALLFLPAAAHAQTSGGKPGQSQAAAQSASQSTASPNLAGTWTLNKDQSDDPRQKMRDAMGRPSEEGSGPTRPQHGAGRPGRGPGPRGGMMAEWSQLNIDETGATVKVTGAGGRLLATTEPQERPQANENGENGGMRFPPQPAAAKWQGSELVAKNQGFGGGTTTRMFELSPDGKQLNVTTKIENERFSQPVTFKFVYDRATNESK